MQQITRVTVRLLTPPNPAGIDRLGPGTSGIQKFTGNVPVKRITPAPSIRSFPLSVETVRSLPTSAGRSEPGSRNNHVPTLIRVYSWKVCTPHHWCIMKRLLTLTIFLVCVTAILAAGCTTAPALHRELQDQFPQPADAIRCSSERGEVLEKKGIGQIWILGCWIAHCLKYLQLSSFHPTQFRFSQDYLPFHELTL